VPRCWGSRASVTGGRRVSIYQLVSIYQVHFWKPCGARGAADGVQS
jgi:hypothetical protein